MEKPGRRDHRRRAAQPADFDPAKKYPLLVVIHGGPTGVSRAVPFTSTIYPIDVWVPRGVLVLEPNYRGSAGYGEKFRALNVRNLGVGDAGTSCPASIR
jgi:dipeptidyl aminopeptidase/acylaminoacyl peptidase